MRRHALLWVIACLCLFLADVAHADVTLRIATLAPAGSSWAKIMQDGAKDLEQRTQGRAKLRFYFSGVQGDEKDFVRKVRLGQLDGAAVTVVGLGLIQPDSLIFQVPLLFETDDEVHAVRKKLASFFDEKFQKAGYELLTWGDVGWAHLYTQEPLSSEKVLRATRMWVWSDDPLQRDFLTSVGFNGVSLGVPDVLPSLQTGVIQGCYGSPLTAVALQWYSKVRYATDEPIHYSVGALVIDKKAFAKLTPADQKTLRQVGDEMGEKLVTMIKKDNVRAQQAMVKAGVRFVPTPPAILADFDQKADVVARKYAGKLYSAELLAQVKQMLADMRGGKQRVRGGK